MAAPVTGYAQNNCSNLLPNPDFENGLTDWTVTGDVSISNDAHSGIQAANICDGSGSLGKAIQTTPGISYQASAWLKWTAEGTFAHIWLRFLDSNYSPIASSGEAEVFTNEDYMFFEVSGGGSSQCGVCPFLYLQKFGELHFNR